MVKGGTKATFVVNKDQLTNVITSLGIVFMPKPDDRDESEYLREVGSKKCEDEWWHNSQNL